MSVGFAALLLTLAQAPPVFRAEVEVVYVDVQVTKKDAPVLGLTADDFVVTDNGVRQRALVLDRSSTPITAVLALDVSASVTGDRLARLRAAAETFLRTMAASDEAALVAFNHKIERLQAPSTDRRSLADALRQLEARGSTAVIDALYLCLKRRWGTGRPVVVLFTDGRDTASWLHNDDVLQAARESSALLHVVGTEAPQSRLESFSIGDAPAPVVSDTGYVRLLRRAAATTGGAYWSASYDRLESVFLDVLEAANARYVLRYEPEGVARSGRHRIEVSVRRRGVAVRARQEYVVPPAGPRS